MQLIQHFTVDVTVNSLHPTFHKYIQSESIFVNKGYSGSGVQDLLHLFSLMKSTLGEGTHWICSQN